MKESKIEMCITDYLLKVLPWIVHISSDNLLSLTESTSPCILQILKVFSNSSIRLRKVVLEALSAPLSFLFKYLSTTIRSYTTMLSKLDNLFSILNLFLSSENRCTININFHWIKTGTQAGGSSPLAPFDIPGGSLHPPGIYGQRLKSGEVGLKEAFPFYQNCVFPFENFLSASRHLFQNFTLVFPFYLKSLPTLLDKQL